MNRIQDIGPGLVNTPLRLHPFKWRVLAFYEDLLERTSIHDRLTSKQASSFKAIFDDREVRALLGTMFIAACCCYNRFSFRSLGEVYLPIQSPSCMHTIRKTIFSWVVFLYTRLNPGEPPTYSACAFLAASHEWGSVPFSHHLLFFLWEPWARVLTMPHWRGLTRPKQLSMAANILSSIFVFGSYGVYFLNHCRLCALSVAIMYQSNRRLNMPPPGTPPPPRAFEFLNIFFSNSPLPRPRSCSNAPL